MDRLHPLVNDVPAPARFTYPFCYEPHPLCLDAAAVVRSYVLENGSLAADALRGKMFGVLIVQAADGRRGFLAAYSGLLAGRNDWPFFVPPVFDAQQPDGYFKQEERAISEINARIAALTAVDAEANARIAALKTGADGEAMRLKEERRERSEALQVWLFRQYRMLNALGEAKDLVEIWRGYHPSESVQRRFPLPPGGTGDCCAPKLLQHAYRQGMRPLAMAEFWIGDSPRGEVRHDGQFYPSCNAKCKPVLWHMLKGLDVEPDPMLVSSASGGMPSEPRIVYEDDAIIVVDKPSGMLSVPGRDGRQSVVGWVREYLGGRVEPMAPHRLDMDTSGLLVIAKDIEAYHSLQRQFLEHKVRKRYVAIVDGDRDIAEHGIIDLPLMPDYLDRPRQVVDRENGKRAITEYRVVGRVEGGYRLRLWPHTGRTHQLRVHCAHAEGLAMPIRGDALYGLRQPGTAPATGRLCLHAERIEFAHPADGRRIILLSEAKNECFL